MDSRPWNRSEIRRRFKRLRRTALLTQKHLSDIIEVCRQSISEIENGRVTPNPNTWAQFQKLEKKYRQPPLVLPNRW